MCPRSRSPSKMTPEARKKEIARLTAKEIFELVREDLLLVEQELARQSATAFEPVSEITGYLLGGGGKRMRPALLLLVNRYAGRRREGTIRIAAQRHADSRRRD